MKDPIDEPVILVVVAATTDDASSNDWPAGKRASIDAHGVVDILPDDHPVEYWICCRIDEPWTWSVMSNQHVGSCTDCAAEIIYRVSERRPTDPAVKKICNRCAARMAEDAEERT